MGATYYFSNSGNDSTGDGSAATPWKTIGKYNTAAAGHSGANTYKWKRGDTFNDATLTVQQASSTFDAWYNADGSDDTSKARPIVGYTNAANLSFSSSGKATVSVSNIHFFAAPVNGYIIYARNAAGFAMSDCTVECGASASCAWGKLNGLSGATLQRNTFIDSGTGSENIALYLSDADAAYSITLQYDIFKGHNSGVAGNLNDMITVYSGAGAACTANLYNNVITGSPERALHFNEGASGNLTVNSYNNIVVGNGLMNANVSPVEMTGTPTINNDYSFFLPNMEKPTSFPSLEAGVTATTHPTNYQVNPKWRSPRYQGIVALTWDDASLLTEHVTDIMPVLNAYGVKGSFMYPVSSLQDTMDGDMNAAKKVLIQSLLASGHDVGSHSFSHSTLTRTNALTISCNGTNAKATIANTQTGVSSTWTGTISINCDEFASAKEYVLTGKSMQDVITALNGYAEGGKTITVAMAGTNPVATGARACALADATNTDITGAGHTFTVDQTEFLQSELDDTRIWLDAQLGVTTKSFAAPGNTWDAAVSTSLAASSFKTARRNGVAAETTKRLSSVNVRTLHIQDLDEIEDDTEATMRLNARAFAMGVVQNGLVYTLNMHSTTSSTPGTVVTAEQLGWLINELQLAGVTVMSMAELYTYLSTAANGWTTADDITYTRTWTDASDYRLRSGSPAINAGVAIDGLTTDILGKPIRGVPDIGAYESQSVGGGLGMGIMYGF
jgi:hypothetical protein